MALNALGFLEICKAQSVSDLAAVEVPVRGPDDLCNGKMWRITGRHGEEVGVGEVEGKGGEDWWASRCITQPYYSP